jgi:hypothetical protein
MRLRNEGLNEARRGERHVHLEDASMRYASRYRLDTRRLPCHHARQQPNAIMDFIELEVKLNWRAIMRSIKLRRRRWITKLVALRPKLAIAIAGCALSILAAVVGGLLKSRIETAATALRNERASTSTEISQRDRLFDSARLYNAEWQQTRLQFHTLAGTRGWVFSPAVESIQNQLADALSYGYYAANGTEPPAGLASKFDEWATSVAQEEARISAPPKADPTSPSPQDQAAVVSAVAGVTSALSDDVVQYWNNRAEMVKKEERLRVQIDASDVSVRRLDSVVLALQIIGLIVVLLKDLVPTTGLHN